MLHDHVIFSKRRKIAERAIKWLKDNNAPFNELNFVSALNAIGALKVPDDMKVMFVCPRSNECNQQCPHSLPHEIMKDCFPPLNSTNPCGNGHQCIREDGEDAAL